MIWCSTRSVSVKVLAPLAICGALMVGAFGAWARTTAADQESARAVHSARAFAGTVELSADLSGDVGLQRAATIIGSERGVSLLAVVAGPEHVVVAANELTLMGASATTLAKRTGAPATERLSGSPLSIAEHQEHFYAVINLDLATLALGTADYRDAFMVLELERGYAGLGGDAATSTLGGLALLFGAIVGLVLIVASVLHAAVLRPLRRIDKAISVRRESNQQVVPLGRSDEIGRLAQSLDDAFARIDETEQSLRESEQRFRSIVEQGDDLLVVLDAAGRITYASPSTGRALGLSIDDIVGHDAFAFVHPEDLEQAGGRFLELIEHPGLPEIQQFEIHLVASDGHLVPVEIRGNNRFDAPGVNGLILNMRDVTERHEALESLRASEVRNRVILESAADGILVLTADGKIESCNGAAERMFGRAGAEMVGAPISLLVPARSECLHDESLCEDGTEQHRTAFVGLECRRADGELLPTEATVSATASEAGIGFTVVLRDVTERREYERRLAHQALHDPLTGLPNRRALLERAETAIARARRSGRLVALLFLDLDQFKVVNDSLGHAQGDSLLCLAAERILHSIRETDTLARIGGDEFVILCEDVNSILSITDLATRLCAGLDEPFRLSGSEAYVGGSIGIAVWEGGDDTADDLLRSADTAMYRAKEGGRGRYELFDEAMQARAIERLDLETALRHAVEHGEMVAHYQPVIDLVTGEVEGFEALVRWARPGFGLVPPDEFIGVAEQTGLIVSIGAWVLNEACAQVSAWQRRFARPDLTMNVNLSSRQLVGPELVEAVRAALETHHLNPRSLTLEITESFLLNDTPQAVGLLIELETLGVRLALDDFGTGYSSLNYLQSCPIDELKIDRSFVRRLDTDAGEALVAVVMHLSHALGLEVVAEGIEEPEQAAALLRLGCRRGQGFLYSPPVDAEALTALLASGAYLSGAPR